MEQLRLHRGGLLHRRLHRFRLWLRASDPPRPPNAQGAPDGPASAAGAQAAADRVGADPEHPAHHLVLPASHARRLLVLGINISIWIYIWIDR